MPNLEEANIVINGETLSVGEAMTLRVAIGSFAMDLKHNGLGNDDIGKNLLSSYLANIKSINKKLMKKG